MLRAPRRSADLAKVALGLGRDHVPGSKWPEEVERHYKALLAHSTAQQVEKDAENQLKGLVSLPFLGHAQIMAQAAETGPEAPAKWRPSRWCQRQAR